MHFRRYLRFTQYNLSSIPSKIESIHKETLEEHLFLLKFKEGEKLNRRNLQPGVLAKYKELLNISGVEPCTAKALKLFRGFNFEPDAEIGPKEGLCKGLRLSMKFATPCRVSGSKRGSE